MKGGEHRRPRPIPDRITSTTSWSSAAGPSGSSCAYWLAEAGLGRGAGREEALPPGEDLRRRAHPPFGPPARRHGARGGPGRGPPFRRPALLRLRDDPRPALARPPDLPALRLRDHPPRSRRDRRRAGGQGGGHRLAGGRGGRADPRGRAGRRRTAPTSAEAPPRCAGAVVKADGAPARNGRCGPATWWWPTGPTPASAGPWAPPGTAATPWGWPCGATTARPATTNLHRVPPRHPGRSGQGGPRLRLDLPPGRRPGERRAWACSPSRGGGRASTPPPDGAFVAWAPGYWELSPATSSGHRPGGSSHGSVGRPPGRADHCWWSATPPAPSTPSTARGSPTATRPVGWPRPAWARPSRARDEALVALRGAARGRLRPLLPGGPGLRPDDQPARPHAAVRPDRDALGAS